MLNLGQKWGFFLLLFRSILEEKNARAIPLNQMRWLCEIKAFAMRISMNRWQKKEFYFRFEISKISTSLKAQLLNFIPSNDSFEMKFNA